MFLYFFHGILCLLHTATGFLMLLVVIRCRSSLFALFACPRGVCCFPQLLWLFAVAGCCLLLLIVVRWCLLLFIV